MVPKLRTRKAVEKRLRLSSSYGTSWPMLERFTKNQKHECTFMPHSPLFTRVYNPFGTYHITEFHLDLFPFSLVATPHRILQRPPPNKSTSSRQSSSSQQVKRGTEGTPKSAQNERGPQSHGADQAQAVAQRENSKWVRSFDRPYSGCQCRACGLSGEHEQRGYGA